MKNKLLVLGLVGVVLAGWASVAMAQQAESRADTRAAIDAANQEFTAAFGRQDSARLASLYTGDGQLFPPNTGMTRGTIGI